MFLSIPGDSSFKCMMCGKRNYFCNEDPDLRQMMRDKELKLADFKSTGNMLIINRDNHICYDNFSNWNSSYRKKYKRKDNSAVLHSNNE